MHAASEHSPAKTLFTLIYAERPSDGDALISLEGPSLHGSHEQAMEEIWDHVRGRIMEACKTEFLECCEELDVDLLGLDPDDIGMATDDQIKDIFSTIRGEQIKAVVDWYFEFMNDEVCECFYKITSHQLPEITQNETTMEADPASQANIDAEAHSDDRVVVIPFNAAPYFAHALKRGKLAEVLTALEQCEFGGDYPADEVAEFFADKETKRLFAYMDFKSGYECNINKTDVLAWLKDFAPEQIPLIC